MFNLGKIVKESGSTLDISAYEGPVEPTMEGMNEILFEGSRAYSETKSALYIADLIVEQQVMEGASMEVLVEGVVKDSFAKIKAVFVNMWAKIKTWFANVKKMYKQITLKGKDFTKQFKAELLDKARKVKGKGFKYKGYHLTPAKGQDEVEDLATVLEKYISNNADSVMSAAEQLADAQGSSEKIDTDADIEKMWSDLKVDNASELAERVRLAFHNGEEQKEMIEDFEANSVQELIEFVERGDQVVKDLDKLETKQASAFKKVIRAIEGAESKATRLEGQAEDKDAPRAAYVTSLVTSRLRVSKAAIAATNTITGVFVSESKSAIAQAQSTLRSLLSFRLKSVKESAVADIEGESIMEAASRFVF